MKHREIIKKVMIDTGTRQIDIAERLQMKSQSAVSERINKDNITLRSMVAILGSMGYELVAQPKTDGLRPEGHYALDADSYQK